MGRDVFDAASGHSPERIAETHSRLHQLYGQRLVRPRIEQALPLESFADAAARLAARSVVDKIVLTCA
ncbi:MAG: hypothetical protein JSR28_02610 [Proteobacteria bacterium]|nr:hypothetical protein [Pseudomonadota bacterium]